MTVMECSGVCFDWEVVGCVRFILSSFVVLTPNGNFWIVPLLHSVSDILLQMFSEEVYACCSGPVRKECLNCTYINAEGISVGKNLGAVFPLSGKICGKSMFFPLTNEFIFNLKYKIHTIQRGSPRYLWCIYEGWNFNSGNYFFTTDTK